jgi:pescadillo protein
MDDVEANPEIKVTHHIMDRPLKNKVDNREYVQPQYLVDSINNLFLLPTAQYTPGTAPPPHLSPFIDSKLEGYVPLREKEILHLKGEEVIDSEDDLVEEAEVVAEKPAAKEKKTEKKGKTPVGKGDADSSSGDDSEEVDPLTTAATRKLANAKLKKDLAEE